MLLWTQGGERRTPSPPPPGLGLGSHGPLAAAILRHVLGVRRLDLLLLLPRGQPKGRMGPPDPPSDTKSGEEVQKTVCCKPRPIRRPDRKGGLLGAHNPTHTEGVFPIRSEPVPAANWGGGGSPVMRIRDVSLWGDHFTNFVFTRTCKKNTSKIIMYHVIIYINY